MKRIRANSVGPGVLCNWAVVLVMACSPSPGSSPIPGGDPGPETGGQTGDPGMSSMDHVSGVARPGSSPAGSCGPFDVTDVQPTATLRWPNGGNSVLVVEVTPGDPRALLVADLAFGLRVVDASQPDSLRVGPALELDSPPLELDRLPDGRFIVLAWREAMLVTVEDDRPTVLGRVALAGRPRTNHVTTSEVGLRLHVVVDSYLEDEDWSHPCPLRQGTSILRYDVHGDSLAERPALDLGDSVQVVRFEGDRALVVTAEGEYNGLLRPSGAHWIGLGEAEPRLGQRTQLGGALRGAAEIRIVGSGLEALVLHPAEARAEVVRFDASDPNAMLALPGCELPLQAYNEVQTYDPESTHWHRSLFTSAGLVVRDANMELGEGHSETGRFVRITDTGCEVQELALPADAELLAGPADTLIAVGGVGDPFGDESAPVDVALFDLSTAPTQVAMISLPVEVESRRVTERRRSAAIVLADAVHLADDTSPETSLLLLPKTVTEPHQYTESLAMVSVGDTTLTERGELDSSYAAFRVQDRLYTTGADRLHAFALDGAALPARLSSGVLWPATGAAWLLPEVIVRERMRAGGDWSEAPAVQVEAVTRDERDPRDILGRLSAAGEAFLLRAGNHIVALELFDEWIGEAPPTLRVLDFTDPAQPREVGRLEDPGLRADWNLGTDPPPLDWSWIATGDALITRSERRVNDDRVDHTAFDFQIVDLRDPSAPRLHEVSMPDDHHSTTAVLAGETLYYTYALPIEGSREQPAVRYFLQTVDVSNPAEPVLADPVNVPGEVIAVDGGTLYLRDAMWDANELKHFVHRAELGADGARIVTSRRMADRPLDARVTGAGDLAVTVLTGPCGYFLCSSVDSKLLLLSAEELEQRGEITVEGRCRIAGQSGDTLVVESPNSNVQLVDISDADAPQLVRTIAPARLADLRGSELLYIRADVGQPGALLRLDLSSN